MPFRYCLTCLLCCVSNWHSKMHEFKEGRGYHTSEALGS